MEFFDQKDYQTVKLAALLHDIGKFLQRVIGKSLSRVKHEKAGGDFVTGNGIFSDGGNHSDKARFSEMISEEWVYMKRLADCIRKHRKLGYYWNLIRRMTDKFSAKELIILYQRKGSIPFQ